LLKKLKLSKQSKVNAKRCCCQAELMLSLLQLLLLKRKLLKLKLKKLLLQKKTTKEA
jgi:hypothetical protein